MKKRIKLPFAKSPFRGFRGHIALAAILLLQSSSTTAQIFSFDSVKVNSKTKLAAFNPHPGRFSTDIAYNKYNFILEDSALISTVLKEIKIGEERSNYQEMPCVHFFLIQDNNQKKYFFLNLKDNSICIGDKTFYCDFENLKLLHNTYPLKVYKVDRPFKTQEMFELFREKELANKNFLFSWSPYFEYEGSVEIIFPHNNKFIVPNDVFQYIDSMMQPLAEKKEYNVTYSPGLEPTINAKYFPITISCSKKLGDKIKTKDAIIHNWKPTIAEGHFFYKK